MEQGQELPPPSEEESSEDAQVIKVIGASGGSAWVQTTRTDGSQVGYMIPKEKPKPTNPDGPEAA